MLPLKGLSRLGFLRSLYFLSSSLQRTRLIAEMTTNRKRKLNALPCPTLTDHWSNLFSKNSHCSSLNNGRNHYPRQRDTERGNLFCFMVILAFWRAFLVHPLIHAPILRPRNIQRIFRIVRPSRLFLAGRSQRASQNQLGSIANSFIHINLFRSTVYMHDGDCVKK